MVEIIEIHQIHTILLGIAKEFHKICVRNGIPYFMLGGTMLGAIRHKGFIPWDDDMDFGVPRKYIDRLLDALHRELPAHLQVITHLDGFGVVNEIIKITDNRTIVDETHKEHLSKRMGLFIDVFPLDETNNNWGKFSRNYIYSMLLAINNERYYPSNNKIHKILVCLIKIIPQSIYFRLIKLLLFDSGEFISNFSGAYGKKETIHKDYFGNPVLYKFHDTYFYGVTNASKYLSCLYNNYMQLPPISDRQTHLKGVFWNVK